MTKYKFIPILFLLILIPVVSSATDTSTADDVFKLNERIDYKKPCFNNGAYCSGATICNYSIYKPDNIPIVSNIESTNQISFYNVSVEFTSLGLHKVDMVCCDGATCGSETFYAEVTGSGFNSTIGFYILILAIGAGLIMFGFKIEDPTITILGSFAFYFIGIYILFNGIAGMKDLVTTWATGLIILGTAGYISTRSAWELIVD